MWRVYLHHHPTIRPWADRINRQPRWLLWSAGLAAGLVVVLPILVLMGAAVLVGLVVFLVLSAVLAIRALPLRLWQLLAGRRGDDGRRNVRIVRSDRTSGES